MLIARNSCIKALTIVFGAFWFLAITRVAGFIILFGLSCDFYLLQIIKSVLASNATAIWRAEASLWVAITIRFKTETFLALASTLFFHFGLALFMIKVLNFVTNVFLLESTTQTGYILGWTIFVSKFHLVTWMGVFILALGIKNIDNGFDKKELFAPFTWAEVIISMGLKKRLPCLNIWHSPMIYFL